ncbi:hypothetical protein [Nocardia terpenica]|uniref:Uncharacterized protein n=1 Tax=Nocardia terpenica TaxID=455432 RepID=A0A164IPT7_9NOCA|nr:hypothetical protein [Nocardia terpenica]KZM69642.1 hypothetical protein AWN90_07645 [Nocardia terpenica]NQE89338.1 hypothetical protein [Nocardia terpenica]
MDYDPTGNEFDLALDTGDDARRMLQEITDLGADFWRTRSRRRTGFNATHVTGYVDPGDGHQYGVVYASGHYARYREHGTRYNAAEHVMADFLRLLEDL